MKVKVNLGGVKTMNAKEQKAALKKKQKENPEVCDVVVCIDKKTGLLKFLRAKNCPPGYMRRVDKALSVGVQINPESLNE